MLPDNKKTYTKLYWTCRSTMYGLTSFAYPQSSYAPHLQPFSSQEWFTSDNSFSWLTWAGEEYNSTQTRGILTSPPPMELIHDLNINSDQKNSLVIAVFCPVMCYKFIYIILQDPQG